MYRWLQDSVWDSVILNYDGCSISEIHHNVYQGIPYWKRILFGIFFGRTTIEWLIEEAVNERTSELR